MYFAIVTKIKYYYNRITIPLNGDEFVNCMIDASFSIDDILEYHGTEENERYKVYFIIDKFQVCVFCKIS